MAEKQPSIQLKAFDNTWYSSGRNKFVVAIWYMVNGIFLNSYLFPFSPFKVAVLRIFGAKVGKSVVIKPKVNIKYPWKLTIGNSSWIGERVWIDNLDDVLIGPNVCISQGAMLLCGNHNYNKTTFDLFTGKIHLEDGVWLGAKAIVCPGIVCKSHAVLAVASVATTNLEAFSIYQGNPAVKIKDRVIN